MTFSSQWTVYRTSQMYVGNDLLSVSRLGGIGYSQQAGSAHPPLVGSGSLFFYAAATAGSPTHLAEVLYTSDPGQASGTLRTVFRINECVTAGGGQAGILCMQSQSNLTASVGNGYGFAWEGGSTSAMRLFLFSGGLSAQSALSTGGFPLGINSVGIMQLHWAVSGSTVTLQAEAGAGTASTALSALYSAVITTSAFTTTQGQGFYAMQTGTATSVLDVHMDVTERIV